jgi:hypothetical protein
MTIIHESMPHDPDSPEAFVFAALLGMFCSVCAPNGWTKSAVERFACEAMKSDGWQAVDKAKLMPGTGSTPNPCNHAPDKRLHHFLMHNP